MARIIAEAGAAEEAAAILNTARWRSRDCDCLFAGRTHARNPLPELGFVA
jgi:hypothetical protein